MLIKSLLCGKGFGIALRVLTHLNLTSFADSNYYLEGAFKIIESPHALIFLFYAILLYIGLGQ